jgi:predicted Fe-Mo cluster-binding NifX family protein
MNIAVTSQNFRTITGHAGKTRRFIIFSHDTDSGEIKEIERLDLPKDMSMHSYRGEDHPIRAANVLITGGCGEGFIRCMARWGIQVIATSETDPANAVRAYLDGKPLSAATSHEH